ncbi:MAG: hypothetical protein ACR2I2_05845 [Bryobacteraceae bacterium]
MALLQTSGKVTFLLVQDVGAGYGPPSDHLDVEVVCLLDNMPKNGFGFQLRNDNNRPARAGMLDLLRDAFDRNVAVQLDYNIDAGKVNATIIRTALRK